MSILLEALRQKSRSDGLGASVKAVESVEAVNIGNFPQDGHSVMLETESVDGLTLESVLQPLNIQEPENLSWQLAHSSEHLTDSHDDASLELLFPAVETQTIPTTPNPTFLNEPFELVIDDDTKQHLEPRPTSQVDTHEFEHPDNLSLITGREPENLISISEPVVQAKETQHAYFVEPLITEQPINLGTDNINPEVGMIEVSASPNTISAASSYVNLVSKKTSQQAPVLTKKLKFDKKAVSPLLIGSTSALVVVSILSYYGWQVWQQDQLQLSEQIARYEAPITMPEPMSPAAPISDVMNPVQQSDLPVPLLVGGESVVVPERKPVMRKKRGDIQTGLETYPKTDSILIHKSLSISSLLSSAWQSWHEGDVVAAEKNYRSVLEKQPNNRDALVGMLVIAQLQPSTLQQAQEIAARLVELYPNDEEINMLIANVSGFSLSKYENNETGLKNQLQKDPNNAAVFYQLGVLYAAEKRWSEAQGAFFKSVSLDPGQPEYLANLAIAYDQLGKVALAAPTYQRALDAARLRPSTLNQDALLVRLHYLLSLQTSIED